MSEVLDKIKSRRSIRKYRSDMIPQDKLEKIIEAGTYAATGMGKQSPIIIAVTNKEQKSRESEAAGSTEQKKNLKVKKEKKS